MSTRSVTIGGGGRVENPVGGTEKRSEQGGHRLEGGHTGGAKMTEERQSPPRARRFRSRAMDAAGEGRQDGALEAGDTDTGEPVVSRSPSEQSDDVRSNVSGASGGGVGKGGPEPRSPRLNGAYGRVRTGELYRAGSTKGARPGCRVEVRGELEITNLFSANDLLRLLEDGPPSFSLQLENVELRVGPNQSARLGEAVPALQEYLRCHLERRLQEVAGSEAAIRLRSFTSRESTASPGGTNGRSAKNTTNILLTGTAVGGVHPLLLTTREKVPPTARADALPSSDVSACSKGTAYQSTDHTLPPAAAKPAAVAEDRTDRARLSVDRATAAAVSAAAGPTVTEQLTQQQRPSAEATTLEQQILEVRGRVKSLLAEEGISTVTAETAALQKKKGEEGAMHDGKEPVGRVSEKDGVLASSMDKSSKPLEPEAREPTSTTTTSQFDTLSVSSSSSSGSRTSAKCSLPHADSLRAESHGSVSAEDEDKAPGKDAALNGLEHTANEVRGRVVLSAEEASRKDNVEQGAASAAVKREEDEEDRKETVSAFVQGKKGGGKDERHDRGTEAALGGIPGQQKLGTSLEQVGKETTVEDLMRGNAKEARSHVLRESKAPVEGVSEVELRDHAEAAEVEERAPGAAEAKVQSGGLKKEERENGKTPTETGTADTRRAERGTAEAGAAAVAASLSEVKQRVHAEAAEEEKAPGKAEAKVQRESMKKAEVKENEKVRTETATAETCRRESGTAEGGAASVAASVSEVNQLERAEAANVEAKAPGEAEAKVQSGGLKKIEEKVNEKMRTETATADTRRAERATAEVGAALIAASVSEVKQQERAEAAKVEEKAPGEAAAKVQTGGLKKTEETVNDKMRAETAAAETRRTERDTAGGGAAPVAASVSEVKQRQQAEVARVEAKAPGEAQAKMQSDSMKKTEGTENEKMRTETATAEARRTERGTAEVSAAPAAADENVQARSTKQTLEREEKTREVTAETRGKDMEIAGGAAAPSLVPQNTGEREALLRIGSIKKSEKVQIGSAQLPRRGGSTTSETSTRVGRTGSGKQVVRVETQVSAVKKIGQTAREKLPPSAPQNKAEESPTTKLQETPAEDATGMPPVQEPLLEKHEQLPGEKPARLMPSKEAEMLSTSERQEVHAKEKEKVSSALVSPSVEAERHGASPSEGEVQGSRRQSKVPEEKSVERPDKDAGELQRQGSAAAGIAAAPTFVQALSNFFFWGASEPESTPSDVPQEAPPIGRKRSAEAVKPTDKAGGEPSAQGGGPTQAAADRGGTSAEEGQEKKKPRPKLKPKAAPASMSKPAKQ